MNLQQYVTENPTKTWSEVQSYTINILSNADTLREYLTLNSKWGKVVAHTINHDDPLFNAASGLIHKVDKAQPISFDAETPNGLAHIFMMNAFVSAGDLVAEEVNEIIALAVTKPFELVTESQFNAAKGVFTEKEVVGFASGNNIKLTFIDAIPENCIATTWVKEDGFEAENFGKISHLKTGISQYKIKTDSKKADGKLFVRVPFENINYTVEAI